MSIATITIRILRRTIDVALLLLIVLVLGTLAISKVVPSVTGGTTFVVQGGSMQPAIPYGSAVIVTPVGPGELRSGDVVSLRVGERRLVFTHRIIRLVPRDDGLWLETRGDANTDPDPALVPASAVIGRLAATIPVAGYAVALLGSVSGIAFVVALACALLMGGGLLGGLDAERRAERLRPVPSPVPGRQAGVHRLPRDRRSRRPVVPPPVVREV